MKKFLLSFILVLFAVSFAFAADDLSSWKKIIKDRTCVLWADAQLLDDIVLNARGNASITWLPRALLRTFEKNKEADEWVVRGLNFYYSSTNKKKLNGRDVVAINYKAVKTWDFNINNFKFENYNISSDDILSSKNEYITGELNSGVQAVVYLALPSKIFKPGKDIKIYLGDDSAIMRLPKR